MSWTLKESDLKSYPHFDTDISLEEAQKLATTPAKVAKHPFYPFIFYEQRWNKWAPKGQKGKTKTRPIRYAARRDAYIFSRYRYELSEKYEEKLRTSGLSLSILAYRKILNAEGSGKCNIDFAKDAFDKIRELKDCIVIALDISDFFGSINHERLYLIWCELLGQKKLSDDHFQVFKAITKYSYIDRSVLYRKLGFIGEKIDPKSGKKKIGYIVPYKDLPKRQICEPKKLRELIKHSQKEEKFFVKHKSDFGIPQGAPISDLLANIYLYNFDLEIKEYTSSLNGAYYRYSDDILLIFPRSSNDGFSAMDFALEAIKKSGKELQIKKEKTYIYQYSPDEFGTQNCKKIFGPTTEMQSQSRTIKHGNNGLEYLGFRFDGKNFYIKDATLSNLWRKVTRSADRFAIQTIRRYRTKTLDEIKSKADIEGFIRKFGRVEDFLEVSDNTKKWTFWTYLKRAVVIFEKDSAAIQNQMKRHRKIITKKVLESLEYYHPKIK